RNRDDGVDDDIFQRIDVAGIPALVGEDAHVIGDRRLVRPQRHGRDDLAIGLETHVDEPVDRQQQEDQEQDEDDTMAGNRMNYLTPFLSTTTRRWTPALVMTV